MTSRLGRLTTRQWAWIVFAFALSVRLVFLLVVNQPSVHFDARRYVSTGVALPLALSDWGLISDPRRQFEIDLDSVRGDLIQDEQIEWLAYRPPTFREAVDDVFFCGPVYPLFLGTVFRLAPRYDFATVRVIQALIDSLTAALLFFWLSLVARRGVALLAGGLYGVSGGSIAKVGELTLEAPTILLIVVCVLLLTKALQDDRRRLMWMGTLGLTWAVVVLLRSTGVGLFAPLLAGWLWGMRRRWRVGVQGCAAFLIVAVLVLAPWVWAVHSRYGTLGVRDPGYAGGNLRASNILESEGYDLDKAFPDYWTYPVWRSIAARPFSYGSLFLRKLYRVWFRPYDDFARRYPFGSAGNLWLHRIVILFALFGLVLWPRARAPDGSRQEEGRYGAVVLLVIGYFAVLHVAFHAVCRYNLPAMPLVVAACAYGVGAILAPSVGMKERGRGFDMKAILRGGGAIVLIGGVCYVGMEAARPAYWLGWFGALSPQAARNLYLASGLTAVALSLIILRVVAGRTQLPWKSGIALAIVIGGVFLTRQSSAEWWSGWTCELRESQQKVCHSVTVDPMDTWADSSISEYQFLFSWDARVAGPSDFRVMIDMDHLHREVGADSIMNPGVFQFPWFYIPFMLARRDRPMNVRQWATWEIEAEDYRTMAADGRIEVTAWIEPVEDGAARSAGHLEVHGDCLTVEDGRRWGPSFQHASVERYYEDIDPRLWMSARWEPVESENRYCEYDSCTTDDLSPRGGRQIGDYRMVFTILGPNGEVRHY